MAVQCSQRLAHLAHQHTLHRRTLRFRTTAEHPKSFWRPEAILTSHQLDEGAWVTANASALTANRQPVLVTVGGVASPDSSDFVSLYGELGDWQGVLMPFSRWPCCPPSLVRGSTGNGASHHQRAHTMCVCTARGPDVPCACVCCAVPGDADVASTVPVAFFNLTTITNGTYLDTGAASAV